MPPGAIGLYWIPVGAGGHFVRLNGLVYEAITAARKRRSRCALFHSVLELMVPSGRYLVEVAPAPDLYGGRRGVVAEGPVGVRIARRLRLFRYEVRRWRDGVVPDLSYAVDSPVVVSDEPGAAEAVFDLLPSVPTLTWGRDELRLGEMWTCNSVISWVLTRAGLDAGAIRRPPRARVPGWHAGVVAAGSR